MLTKKMHPSLRVTVGIAVSTNGLIGPFFFKQTVNSEHCLSMMHMFYVSAYCYWFAIKYPVICARWGGITHTKHCFGLPECGTFGP